MPPCAWRRAARRTAAVRGRVERVCARFRECHAWYLFFKNIILIEGYETAVVIRSTGTRKQKSEVPLMWVQNWFLWTFVKVVPKTN